MPATVTSNIILPFIYLTHMINAQKFKLYDAYGTYLDVTQNGTNTSAYIKQGRLSRNELARVNCRRTGGKVGQTYFFVGLNDLTIDCAKFKDSRCQTPAWMRASQDSIVETDMGDGEVKCQGNMQLRFPIKQPAKTTEASKTCPVPATQSPAGHTKPKGPDGEGGTKGGGASTVVDYFVIVKWNKEDGESNAAQSKTAKADEGTQSVQIDEDKPMWKNRQLLGWEFRKQKDEMDKQKEEMEKTKEKLKSIDPDVMAAKLAIHKAVSKSHEDEKEKEKEDKAREETEAKDEKKSNEVSSSVVTSCAQSKPNTQVAQLHHEHIFHS